MLTAAHQLYLARAAFFRAIRLIERLAGPAAVAAAIREAAAIRANPNRDSRSKPRPEIERK